MRREESGTETGSGRIRTSPFELSGDVHEQHAAWLKSDREPDSSRLPDRRDIEGPPADLLGAAEHARVRQREVANDVPEGCR
jgi:hypothetical protein